MLSDISVDQIVRRIEILTTERFSLRGNNHIQRAAREAKVRELLAAMREQASRTLMFHQAVTDLVGLGPTDMKALDLARGEKYLTAGRLAEATGLSTSATTAVLDRLERRGFVRRERDPADRRKVVVVPTGRHDAELEPIFSRIADLTRQALDDYDEDQLALLVGFIQRLNATAQAVTRSITSGRLGHSAD
jgi:DNA-binding MarR family transcriptional regulator